jgi:radical SAM protein with 4Fe4S-binding SPASM domain
MMKILKDFFRIHLPEKPVQIEPGIYHFRREAGGNVTRFHLRVESDSSGVLLANASIAARLSSTGVLIAKARLEGMPYPAITTMIKDQFYGATETQIEADVQKIGAVIGELASMEDNYPIFNLDDPAMIHPQKLLLPFHAQMPVAQPEQLNPLLQKLWDGGIMHVTFSVEEGGNEISAQQNVERVEDLGMICGVRATANWFLQPGLFEKLALAGVDYIIVPAVSVNAAKQDPLLGANSLIHADECLRECKKWEVTPVLEIPVFRGNINELEQIANEFSVKGGKNLLYYAITNEHQQDGLTGIEIIHAASAVSETSRHSNVRYLWLPAVSRAGELTEIVRKGPRTAGDVSIRIDPDGSVYAPRGLLVAAGNLFNESLTGIWNRSVFRRYRERVESPTRCDICPELEICAADCPADPQGWARGRTA